MKFSEVAIGQKVKVNDKVAQKIADKRVSCCKTHNVVIVGENTSGFVDPNTEVELVTE